jgi:hypothetical protein
MSKCKYKHEKQEKYFELKSTDIFWDATPWLKFSDVSEKRLPPSSGKKISPATNNKQQILSVSSLLV